MEPRNTRGFFIMAKKKEETKTKKPSQVELVKLSGEVQAHHESSKNYMSDLRSDWGDKEAMLIGNLSDEVSESAAKSQVFDPRLSTIIFERAARVMAQEHVGKSFAESKNDIGKNKLMDLMLNYYTRHADEQYKMLVKLRMMDIYSLVYGSFFALVPWRVDSRRNYIGPELILKPIRDVFPQPNVIFNSADWVQVRDYVSVEWLKKQAKSGVWFNIGELERELKESGGDTRQGDSDKTSDVEERYHSNQGGGDKSFPLVELITEYRHDRWITFAPRGGRGGLKGSKIVRVLDDPYVEGKLPVVKKDAFPLIDRAIGLGEFERGQTLQFAINSLINLYLDGVKYSMFPPLQINPDAEGLVPSSIKWGPGERWFVGRPNQDIQTTAMSPLGINTFNSTYGFLVSAIQNMSGTSSVEKSKGVESAVGKTPQAIQFLREKENARDDWDRFMMEQTLHDIYERWQGLIVRKLEKPQVVRIYGEEIKSIQEQHPDVTEMFESGEQGRVKVDNKQFVENGDPINFDYRVEVGSTIKRNTFQESQAAANLLELIASNPDMVQKIDAEGKKINYSELLERTFATSGIQDWNKIITDKEPEVAPGQESGNLDGQQDVPSSPTVPSGTAAGLAQFQNPAVAEAAGKLFGNMTDIPVQ